MSEPHITDEMVEAGIEEIRNAKHTCFDRWTDHDAIRAVLTAALSVAETPPPSSHLRGGDE